MSSTGPQQGDPNVTLQRLRGRILGGGRPPLESLSAKEMVAANTMISGGEAEIASYSCRLFLIAKLHDEPAGLRNLMAATKKFLERH